MRSLSELIEDYRDRITKQQASEADTFLRVFSGQSTREDGERVLSILKRELELQNGYDGGPIEATQMAVIHGEANAFRKIMSAVRIARQVRSGKIQIMEDDVDGSVRIRESDDRDE